MQDNTAAYDAAQNAETEEVSLDTLSEEEIKKIMTAFRSGRDVAENYYTSVVEPALIKRLDVYRASRSRITGYHAT